MTKIEKDLLSEEDKKLTNEQTYDLALASMVTKLDGYIVPLINEAFGEKFTDRAKVVLRNNKHVIQHTDGSLARRDSDAVIELSEQMVQKLYLIECEAWYDKTIVMRIAEYDSSVAVETARVTEEGVILTHPNSAVVFLHPNGEIPKKMKITHRAPNGEEMSYFVPTMKIGDYSVEDIFQKKLLILLPFYLFRFAKELPEMEEREDKRKELEKALIDINQRLESLKAESAISEYQKRMTQELLLRVSDRLVVGYETIRKEVDEIMSGALARTKADEILEQGQNETKALFGYLLQQGRNEDVQRAVIDEEFFKELLLEFRKVQISA